MTGYGIRRVLEVTVESLRPFTLIKGGKPMPAAALYGLSNSEARTFNGSDWVPMQEVGNSGSQFSVQLAISQEEMWSFFDRAFKRWEGSLRFLAHVSLHDAKVGMWTAPGLRFRPVFSTDHGPDMPTVTVLGYEDELPAMVADAVLSLLVMES